MIRGDYKGINRSLKRKVKDARKKDLTEITVSVDYLSNVSDVFDELVFEKSHPQISWRGEWVNVKEEKLQTNKPEPETETPVRDAMVGNDNKSLKSPLCAIAGGCFVCSDESDCVEKMIRSNKEDQK